MRLSLPLAVALTFVAIVAGPALTQAAASEVPPIAFDQRVLPNGLTVLTSLDRTTPNVTVQVWYHVGAKNDPAGRSGFAHLFEHLMFKATADMPPEYLDRLTEDVGGMNNAFTEDDATAFYEVIPANHLQRLIWAEAERMNALVVDQANYHSERNVVEEELRQTVLASPYGRFFTLDIPKDSFAAHPYRRPAIGSIADLEAASLDDVRAFHQTFYRPDDATLIVVGNFDRAELTTWIDRFFGLIERPAAPMPKVTVVEPPRDGPKAFIEYGPNVPLPAVAITWLAPSAASPDAAALKVLDALLTTGKSSRLYDHLVYRQQLADEVSSSADLRAQAGLFWVAAIMAAGKSADAGEAALRAEIADLRQRPVSAAELDIAKSQLVADAVRSRETVDGRAMELGQAVVEEGDPNRANTDIADVAAVTVTDVRRVARKYLADDARVVIRFLPQSQRPAGAAAEPARAPPTPSQPFKGAIAALRPPDQRQSPPPIGAAVRAILPQASERTLANGLRVIVARSSDLPLIAANLLVGAGASADPAQLAGAARLTADLVTEGTASRSAPRIAQEIEALGANLDTASAAETSSVTLNVLADKAAPALAVMADVAEHPIFAADELERARKEALDDLAVAYRKPGSVARILTDPVVFAATPLGHAGDGTPASLQAISRSDIVTFHARYWRPDNAALVITGDVSPEAGFALADRAFGGWTRRTAPLPARPPIEPRAAPRAIAVDLPGTGQAAVVLAGPAIARGDPRFYGALVANAVLGGGYSARLNAEIRVKRGLSYGAGSLYGAMSTTGVFVAEAQTKNDSAAQVAGLIGDELARLAAFPASPDELVARESALIGEFGRSLATAEGLADELGALATSGVALAELGAFPDKVGAVTAAEAQAVARDIFDPARMSLVVVGDATAFAAPLEAQQPHLRVIPIGRLDPDAPSLEKP